MNFLRNLTEEGVISLFGNANMTHIVDYLWGRVFPFMWSHIFAPFFFMNFLPVLALTVINFWLISHNKFSPILLLIYSILLIILTFGNLRSLYWEVKEVQKKGIMEYVTSLQNYFQLGLIISTVSVTLSSYNVALNVWARNASEDPDSLYDSVHDAATEMTYAVVVCMIFMMLEFPNQLKIFAFFSPFCRALSETIQDSAQILFMLLLIVFFQMFMLWVLDANSDQPAYGEGSSGFWPAFIDSYRMSVGDFEVVGTFEGRESFLFWAIFLIGNLVSLLIILNMVIAVMSATFERVQEDVDSYINKLKIENLLEYAYRFSPS